MAVPVGFARARLDIEPGLPLECWFNPSSYSVSKANVWTMRPVVGTSLPTPQFSGGLPRELTLELLFDDPSPEGDVSLATNALLGMMEVDAALSAGRNQARPPSVTFSWGFHRGFKAVCRKINVDYTMFHPDGTPIRAMARLELLQIEKDLLTPHAAPPPPQNPTTRATRRLGAHIVTDGDSLSSIAFQHYRDPSRWRAIAEANGLDDPLRLTRGSTLAIPLIEQ